MDDLQKTENILGGGENSSNCCKEADKQFECLSFITDSREAGLMILIPQNTESGA